LVNTLSLLEGSGSASSTCSRKDSRCCTGTSGSGATLGVLRNHDDNHDILILR
jgi:hypothetical protein